MIYVEEISIDFAMVEEVIGWDQPTNTEGVCKFLKEVGYCQHFVKRFSCIAAPLMNLFKKGFYFNWDPKCEKSIIGLKCQLITALVLVFSKVLSSHNLNSGRVSTLLMTFFSQKFGGVSR